MVGSLIDFWDGPGLGTGTAKHQLHLIPHCDFAAFDYKAVERRRSCQDQELAERLR